MSDMLIYGSYGYTGKLIVPLAISAGIKPILAGRTRDKTEAHAKEFGLESRVFALEDPAEIDRALAGVSVVLHCAGPFSRTAVPMAQACIRNKCHYLDITGEIEVFEALHGMDADAKTAGVMLMPGTGFDVVPSDCLAAHLKSKLPDAFDLVLAIQAIGRPSRGTATTMIENVHKGGLIRVNGKLSKVPSAWQTLDFDLGEGDVSCMTIPWGDVSTAYYSTGIPNIRVFMAAPPQLRTMAVISRYFGPVLASGPVQGLIKRNIQKGPAGPSDEEREKGHSLVWGRVENKKGKTAEARLRTPEGYTLTARTSLAIAQRALNGDAPAGFQTPSMAYGADFVLQFEDIERTDL